MLALNYEFPPLGGGAGNATLNICRELDALGQEVAVLTSHFQGLPRRERIGGVEVHRVRVLRRRLDRSSPLEMGSFVLAAALPAASLARRLRPDVLHVYFGIPTGPVGLFVHLLTGVPYLLSLRGGDVPGFLKDELAWVHRLTGPLTRAVWGQAAAVVANSQGLGALAQRSLPGRPVHVIPNGVDTRRFRPAPEHANPGPGVFRILSAGRLVEQKGVRYVIEALPQVAAAGRRVEFAIVGSGPSEESLRRLAQEVGVAGQVCFLGWLDREELAARYRASDAFVLPSFEEGMPNVVLEAMASGLPIVTTDIYGNRELVRDGEQGFLVPPGDAAAVGAALARLAADPDLARSLGRQARQRAEGFSWGKVAQAYLDLSEKALAAPPAGAAHRSVLPE
ncbi:MAG: glycosyltransferase [Chloroflexi bacterium]|nr:glycosyltransferase [Chloroflexota bacterium]